MELVDNRKYIHTVAKGGLENSKILVDLVPAIFSGQLFAKVSEILTLFALAMEMDGV